MTIFSEPEVEQVRPRERQTPVYQHVLPKTTPGEPLRIQVSLKPEFDPEDTQVAYICRPWWADGKYVVMDAEHNLVDWDGHSFEPTDPENPLPDEDMGWYLFDLEDATDEARKLVQFYTVVRCVDCDVDTSVLGEYYMVNDEVWVETGLDVDGGMLCIGCLEARIGRRLGWNDFTDALINCAKTESYWGKSERLRERMCNDEGWSLADLNIWSKLNPEDKKRWLDTVNSQ